MQIFEQNGHRETIWERSDLDPAWVKGMLNGETLAVFGYGTQGQAQALNLRDGGYPVILGLRPGGSYDRALADGWLPGVNLLSLPEAAARGTIWFYLLSDAGQKQQWSNLLPHLTLGKALVLAHGFSVVYASMTGIVPPSNVDVLLVAPKGSGTTMRQCFLRREFMNAGIAVEQEATGRGHDRCLALAYAVGCGNLFETTMKREVVADLFGERGSLLGAIYGLWLAQYEVMREHGHPPLESFSETVEEATQSLYPLIAELGIDGMYAQCSVTAQRGALDWYRRFRDAVKPVFEELYLSVAAGAEAKRALEANASADYRQQLAEELTLIAQSEMWQAGRTVRHFRLPPATT